MGTEPLLPCPVVVVAVTGGIGSGKSTVAGLLARRGAFVIDADQIAREVVEPTGPAYQAVADHFGPGVVGGDGLLNRAALAARVFANPAELATLNALTHPAIAAAMAAGLAEHAGTDRFVVVDIPLLDADSKVRYGFAGVIVVDAPAELAVRRLVGQRGLAEADARARIESQIGREERRRLADVIIDNSGTRGELAAAVGEAWSWMERLAGGG